MKIITITTGDTSFLDIQMKSFKKFLNCPYEFIVFNGCSSISEFSNDFNENALKNVESFCQINNIKFINCFNLVKQYIYDKQPNGSGRHACILHVVFDYIKKNPDQYFMIDSDMFFIDNYDLEGLKQFKSAIVLHERPDLKYLWPNLWYIDSSQFDDLEEIKHFAPVNGGDCGAQTEFWLEKQNMFLPTKEEIEKHDYDYFNNKGFKIIKYIESETWSKETFPEYLPKELLQFCKEDFRNKNYCYFFSELYDKKIFHLRAGSNWIEKDKSMHVELKHRLINVMNIIMS